MHKFEYTTSRVRVTPDGSRFRIGRIAALDGPAPKDLSHLLDRTYDYASPRELRWHIAERFGLAVGAVVLTRH